MSKTRHSLIFSETRIGLISQKFCHLTDNKKEQERAELHCVIWNIANALRGSVAGWDFKQYFFRMLFYSYISENLTAYLNSRMPS